METSYISSMKRPKGASQFVQYRVKHVDTGDMITMAKSLHKVTQRRGVPLLINDRVDVCMAIGAEGVHLGQDDMSLDQARSMLGPDAIIGITAQNIEEAQEAVAGGADYLGIGTMFATPTKTDTRSIIGTAGTREILRAISKSDIKTVSIGGINASTVQRVLYQSTPLPENKSLDGVAVVSAIIASSDPQSSARDLRYLIKDHTQTFYSPSPSSHTPEAKYQYPPLLHAVHYYEARTKQPPQS